MARKKEGLGPRHKKILQVLEKFANQNGYPPSIREIGTAAEISSTSVVNYYLEQLAEMGYIERDRNISRGVRLLKSFSDGVSQQVKRTAENVQAAVEDLIRVPRLGRIGASLPMPNLSSDFMYDSDNMIEVARSMVPRRDEKDLFALEVQGDSMIDAMVHDGDIVIMKRATEARNGDMVAVWLEDKDETTLKYFFRENNRVRLQPANPTMGPIYVEDPGSLRVQGKVVMVIRQVGNRVN